MFYVTYEYIRNCEHKDFRFDIIGITERCRSRFSNSDGSYPPFDKLFQNRLITAIFYEMILQRNLVILVNANLVRAVSILKLQVLQI